MCGLWNLFACFCALPWYRFHHRLSVNSFYLSLIINRPSTAADSWSWLYLFNFFPTIKICHYGSSSSSLSSTVGEVESSFYGFLFIVGTINSLSLVITFESFDYRCVLLFFFLSIFHSFYYWVPGTAAGDSPSFVPLCLYLTVLLTQWCASCIAVVWNNKRKIERENRDLAIVTVVHFKLREMGLFTAATTATDDDDP